MPLYEYECDACGHRFEVIQKMSDPQIEKCPVCGGTVHKLQSAPAFQFKGSGWYVTDYARKDAGKTATADGAAPDAGKDKSEKTEKTDKSDKSQRADRSDTTAKTDKAAPATDKSSKSTSSTKDS